MLQINTISDNAKQSRALGISKFNPFAPGTCEYVAYELGWAGFNTLPAVSHPYTEYTLQDSVLLAISNSQLQQSETPTTLEEVREVIQVMAERAGLWMTGMAALDVLDAAIDARDLRKSCRLC